jgi:hypothetical protein
MNIELDEVVLQDVSDDALELAAGGAQGVDIVAPTERCTGAGCFLGLGRG